ncbi:MAG TPA: alpha/beta hydrolase [Melioribacteraceae bacterium]|nr:alpha/beta hydrolase [Melioribacteraceae bacterium]
MKSFIRFLFILVLTNLNIFAQTNLEGFYKGSIHIMEQNIDIEIEFAKNNGTILGLMNIPIQGAKKLPLNKLLINDGDISFEIMDAPRNAIFKGKIESDSIWGTFSQLGFEGNFLVHKSIKPLQETNIIVKDYVEEEVVFSNGDIKIAGTLSYIKNTKNLPAVILISGSGAQNRNSDVYGFKLFENLADHLTRSGIAVLRCDDRGVGGSSGNVQESTSEDFADDIIAAYNFLKSVSVINPNKIGLYGHSEGGIIAPIAISKLNDVAFTVLVSAPAVTGEEIIYKQVELIMRANKSSESEINIALHNNKEIFEIIKNGANYDSLKVTITRQVKEEFERMPEENRKQIKDMDAFVNALVDNNIKIYNNNWFKFFLNYNPAPTLQNIKCPVLLVFGGLDKQVFIEQNREILEKELKNAGNTKVTSLLFENANHLFQKANSGSPNEYSKLEKKYITGFLEQITDWILNTVK